MRAKTKRKIPHPWRVETMISKNDETMLEVLFYYTDMKNQDGAIDDGDLTPLVIKDRLLIGWGWSYLKQISDVYDIRVQADIDD